ncbi:MAG: hypothetical protein AB7F59_13575 [Bdellovibrionales bacterium]
MQFLKAKEFVCAFLIFSLVVSPLAQAEQQISCLSVMAPGSTTSPNSQSLSQKTLRLERDTLIENAEVRGETFNQALLKLFQMAGSVANFTQLVRETEKKGEFKLAIPLSKNETIELDYVVESRFQSKRTGLLKKISLIYGNQEVLVLAEKPVNKDVTEFTTSELKWEDAMSIEGRVGSITIPITIPSRLLEKYINWTEGFVAASAVELRKFDTNADRRWLWVKYAGHYLKDLITKRFEKELVRNLFQIGFLALVGYSGFLLGSGNSKEEQTIDWSLVDKHKINFAELLNLFSPDWKNSAPAIVQTLAKVSKENPSPAVLDLAIGYGDTQKLIAYYAQKVGAQENGVLKFYSDASPVPLDFDHGQSVTEFPALGILVVTDLILELEKEKSTMSLVINQKREPELYKLIADALAKKKSPASTVTP